MKLENQCCTETQSQRLYELGVFGETLFYHTSSWGIMPKSSIDFKNGHVLNAFTVAELGAMLLGRAANCHYNVHRNLWQVYTANSHPNSSLSAVCKTQAKGYADLLIDGLITGGFTAEDCNNRLTAA